MATVPSLEELERAVFDIFRGFGCRAGDVLMLHNLNPHWFDAGRRANELTQALNSLIDKGWLERVQRDGYRLTQDGFAAM